MEKSFLTYLSLVALAVCVLSTALVGCNNTEKSTTKETAQAPEKEEKPGAAKSSKEAAQAPEKEKQSAAKSSGQAKIKVGSSCEGLDPMKASMHCEGSKVLFCSSVTKYKYIVQMECPDGEVCEMADPVHCPEGQECGKSANCVASK